MKTSKVKGLDPKLHCMDKKGICYFVLIPCPFYASRNGEPKEFCVVSFAGRRYYKAGKGIQ